MNAVARILFRLVVSAALGLSVSYALARPQAANADNGCLSNLEINLLAKQRLPSLQSIDPNVSLGDVKTVINGVGDCVTLETASLALDGYAASLIPPAQNTAPSIGGTPSTIVAEGANYAFFPSAFDQDGDSLTFMIQNTPAWSTFDSSSGALTGSPGFSDAGLYRDIVISATDGVDTVSLDPFTIEVVNTNRPPTISGTPQSKVLINQPYSFIPSASDPDGDTLSYAIQSIPSWASFDLATGELFGTPTEAGIDTGIVISAYDGTIKVALNEFSITVEDGVVLNGIANLMWEYPTTRVDGTFLPVNEIAGYRVYMGPTQDSLEMIVDLYDGTANSYTVAELTPGTYFFSVTTYDVDGLESGFSNVVSIDI